MRFDFINIGSTFIQTIASFKGVLCAWQDFFAPLCTRLVELLKEVSAVAFAQLYQCAKKFVLPSLQQFEENLTVRVVTGMADDVKHALVRTYSSFLELLAAPETSRFSLGEMWCHLSAARLALFSPRNDPVAICRKKQQQVESELSASTSELEVLTENERVLHDGGRTKRMEALEVQRTALEAKAEKLSKQAGKRHITAFREHDRSGNAATVDEQHDEEQRAAMEFSRLQTEVARFMSTIGSRETIAGMLAGMRDEDKSKSERVKYWQAQAMHFARTLFKRYQAFTDLTAPIIASVMALSHGLHLCTSQRRRAAPVIEELLEYPQSRMGVEQRIVKLLPSLRVGEGESACGGNLINYELVLKQQAEAQEQSRVVKQNTLSPKTIVGLLRSCLNRVLLDPATINGRVFTTITALFASFSNEWIAARNVQIKEAERLNAEYEYKHAKDIALDDKEEENEEQMLEVSKFFPSFEDDFTDVLKEGAAGKSASLKEAADKLNEQAVKAALKRKRQEERKKEEYLNSVLDVAEFNDLVETYITLFTPSAQNTQLKQMDVLLAAPAHQKRLMDEFDLSLLFLRESLPLDTSYDEASFCTSYILSNYVHQLIEKQPPKTITAPIIRRRALTEEELRERQEHVGAGGAPDGADEPETEIVIKYEECPECNIHIESNLSEAKLCIEPLKGLIRRVNELLAQFEGNEVLLVIVSLASKVIHLPTDAPLMKYLTGLELLSKQVQTWESYASKAVSLADYLKALAGIIGRWRKLELRSWCTILDQKERETGRLALSYWPRLYASLISCAAVPLEKLELSSAVTMVDDFLQQSSIGEFETRLRLVLALAGHSLLAALAETRFPEKRRQITNALFNEYSYYRQYLPECLKKVQAAKKTPEAQLKELIQISKWDNVSFYMLQENAGRSHKKLVKLAKDYTSSLKEPVSVVFSQQVKSNQVRDDDQCKGKPVDRKAFSLEPCQKPETDGSAEVATKLAERYGATVSPDPDARFCFRLPALVAKARQVYATGVSALLDTLKLSGSGGVAIVEEAASTVVEQMQDLSSMTAKNKKLATQSKRRALAALFTWLRGAGLSNLTVARENTKFFNKSDFAFDELLMNMAFPKHASVMRLLASCPRSKKLQAQLDKLAETTVSKADEYYYKALSKYVQLKSAAANGVHQDITQREVSLSQGLLTHLLSLLSEERDLFASVSLEAEDTLRLLNDLRAYAQSVTPAPVILDNARALSLVHDHKDIVVDFIKLAREALLYASSSMSEPVDASTLATLGSVLDEVRSAAEKEEEDGCLSLVSLTYLLSLKQRTEKLVTGASAIAQVTARVRPFARALAALNEKIERFSASMDELLRKAHEHQQEALDPFASEQEGVSEFLCRSNNLIEKILVVIQTTSRALDETAHKSVKSGGSVSPSQEKLSSTSDADDGVRDKEDDAGEDDDELNEKDLLLTLHLRSMRLLKHLNLKGVARQIKELIGAMESLPDSASPVVAAQFSQLARLSTVLLSTMKLVVFGCVQTAKSFGKLLYILGSVFLELYKNGFCIPPDESEEQDSKQSTTFDDDVSGTGMGEGEGKKDVSDQIESADQLMGDNAEQKEENEETEQKDLDKGFDMEEDFNGTTEDVPEDEDKEDEDKEDEENKEDEMDREMGEDLDGAEQVDKKMWNDEEDEKPEEIEEEEGEGKEEGDDDQVEGIDGDEEQQKNDSKKEEKPPKKEKDTKDEGQTEDEDQADEEELPESVPNTYLDPKQAEDLELSDEVDEEMDQEVQDDENDSEDSVDSEDDDDGEHNEDDKEKDDVPENGEESDSADQEQEEGIEELPEQEQDNVQDEANTAMKDEQADRGSEGEEEQEKEDANNMNEDEQQEEDRDAEEQQDRAETVEENVGQRAKMSADNQEGEENNDTAQQETSGAQGGDDTTKFTPQERPQQQESHEQTEDKKRKKQLPKNEFKSLGDAMKEWKKRLDIKETSKEEEGEESEKEDDGVNEDPDAKEFELVEKDDGKDHQQALSAIEEDEAKPLPNENKEEEDDEEKQDESSEDRKNESDKKEEKEMDVEDDAEDESKTKKSKQKSNTMPKTVTFDKDDDSEDDEELEKKVDDEDLTDGRNEDEEKKQSIISVPPLSSLTSELIDDQQEQKEVSEELVDFDQDKALEEWTQHETAVSALSQQLCEQLRIILEPTLATQLKGDYKTGKRINMRKVIAYIASDFKKDKIWLRRTKPHKRNYQVVVAIDDSESMAQNHAGKMALEALALLTSALTKLEVGEIGVIRFGEVAQVLHKLSPTFSSQDGAKVVSQFSFEQKKTSICALMRLIVTWLQQSKLDQSPAKIGTEFQQIVFIISDGRFGEHKGLAEWVLEAQARHILIVFLVIDTTTEKDSILNVRRVIYNGKPELHYYMDTFPFPFYTILRDLETLPDTLASALRQWFEFLNHTNE